MGVGVVQGHSTLHHPSLNKNVEFSAQGNADIDSLCTQSVL